MNPVLNLKDTHRIVVKFSFTNPTHIPPGIPQKRRESDDEMDQRHALGARLMGQESLGEVGRVREGRVDTGECVVKDLGMVQSTTIRRAFTNAGFRLSTAHWFIKKANQPGKQDKFMVALTFSNVVTTRDPEIEQTPAMVSALRDLARNIWGYCHVWSNPGGTVTMNFLHLNRNKAPWHAFRIKKGELCVAEISRLVTEEEEDQDSRVRQSA